MQLSTRTGRTFVSKNWMAAGEGGAGDSAALEKVIAQRAASSPIVPAASRRWWRQFGMKVSIHISIRRGQKDFHSESGWRLLDYPAGSGFRHEIERISFEILCHASA